MTMDTLDQEYDAIEAVRWSRLKAMATSPLQYQHELAHERADSVSLRVGRAIHTIVLEGMEVFAERYVVYGGSRRGKAWKEFEEEHAHQEILTGVEAARAQNSADAVLNDPVARRHLREGLAETIIEWVDPETGIKCKARVDLLNGHQVELKSTKDPEPESFARDFYKFMYQGQLSFYGDGILESGYDVRHGPTLITVGSEEPHDVVVYEITEETLEIGRRLKRKLLLELRACIDRNEWPGIARGKELTFMLPPWALEREAEDEPVSFAGVEVASG